MTKTHKVMRSVGSTFGFVAIGLVIICLAVFLVFRYWGLTAAVNMGTIIVILIAAFAWCCSLGCGE